MKLNHLALASSALLASCVSSFEPADVCPGGTQFRRDVVATPYEAPSAYGVAGGIPAEDQLLEDLLGVMSAPGPSEARRDLLVLSGGGQFGAYGAGLLQSFVGDVRRGEKFAAVTGVSTGAFQATAAFLGDEASLAEMVDGYDIDAESELATPKKTLFGFPTQTALYSLAPARATFAKFMTDARLDAVGAADAQSRKLYVGVVDVKDGQFYAFDLTALAASDLPYKEKRDCYVEAVFASAAVPVVYEPVVLDGRQYFDGGVRSSAFLDRAAAVMAGLGAEGAARSTLYVVFNNYLDLPEQPGDGRAIKPLSALNRTRSIAFDQIDRDSLARLKQFADRYDIRWTNLPAGACAAENTDGSKGEVFNPPFMRCLVAKGREDGKSADVFRPLKH